MLNIDVDQWQVMVWHLALYMQDCILQACWPAGCAWNDIYQFNSVSRLFPCISRLYGQLSELSPGGSSIFNKRHTWEWYQFSHLKSWQVGAYEYFPKWQTISLITEVSAPEMFALGTKSVAVAASLMRKQASWCPVKGIFSSWYLANSCPLFEHMWQAALWLWGQISLIKRPCLVSAKGKQQAYS